MDSAVDGGKQQPSSVLLCVDVSRDMHPCRFLAWPVEWKFDAIWLFRWMTNPRTVMIQKLKLWRLGPMLVYACRFVRLAEPHIEAEMRHYVSDK